MAFHHPRDCVVGECQFSIRFQGLRAQMADKDGEGVEVVYT